VSEYTHDWKFQGGLVWPQSLEHVWSPPRGDADAPDGNVHGLEVLAVFLVDPAVKAFLIAKSLE
jgi:hypothetical protein